MDIVRLLQSVEAALLTQYKLGRGTDRWSEEISHDRERRIQVEARCLLAAMLQEAVDDELLDASIETIGLSNRASNALMRTGYKTVRLALLVTKRDAGDGGIGWFGAKSLADLDNRLRALGLQRLELQTP